MSERISRRSLQVLCIFMICAGIALTMLPGEGIAQQQMRTLGMGLFFVGLPLLGVPIGLNKRAQVASQQGLECMAETVSGKVPLLELFIREGKKLCWPGLLAIMVGARLAIIPFLGLIGLPLVVTGVIACTLASPMRDRLASRMRKGLTLLIGLLGWIAIGLASIEANDGMSSGGSQWLASCLGGWSFGLLCIAVSTRLRERLSLSACCARIAPIAVMSVVTMAIGRLF